MASHETNPVSSTVLDQEAIKLRWRVGGKVGRTVYAQKQEELSPDDYLLGMMDSPELAKALVKAHNFAIGMDSANGVHYQEDDTVALWRVGRKLRRTIYVVEANVPVEEQRLIGMLDTPLLAEHIVEAHNELVSGDAI